MDIEDDEDEELICARTFNVHKECMVNNITTVRLEEIEHFYEEFAWMHIIAKEDYYNYEWVIKFYVKEINPFIYQSTNRIQSRFNFPQEICRLKRYKRTMKMGN
jgi:hypothetical protein